MTTVRYNRTTMIAVRKTLLAVLAFFLIVCCASTATPAHAQTSNQFMEGRVEAVTETGKLSVNEELVPFQTLQIAISRGELEGQTVEVQHVLYSNLSGQTPQEYAVGDQLRLVATTDADGQPTVVVDGQLRRPGLLLLLAVFIIVVLVVGRVWGALSLLGLAISFVVISSVIVPLIMTGLNPVLSAIIGSIIIIPSTFYISHGFNSKTSIGVISTIIILTLVGVLATSFVNMTHLTGFASEEAGFLAVENQGKFNMVNLIIAGIIIATLGALDDITVGQASVIQQLKRAKPTSSIWELFSRGMKVGQDHISSMVNTLILVYTGASLPLIMLFYDSQKAVLDIIEYEVFAEEIVWMLVSSTGLVLAAPLATGLAAWWFAKHKVSDKDASSGHEHVHG